MFKIKEQDWLIGNLHLSVQFKLSVLVNLKLAWDRWFNENNERSIKLVEKYTKFSTLSFYTVYIIDSIKIQSCFPLRMSALLLALLSLFGRVSCDCLLTSKPKMLSLETKNYLELAFYKASFPCQAKFPFWTIFVFCFSPCRHSNTLMSERWNNFVLLGEEQKYFNVTTSTRMKSFKVVFSSLHQYWSSSDCITYQKP